MLVRSLAVGLSVFVWSLAVPAVGVAGVPHESRMVQVDAAHRGYVDGAGVVPPLRRAWQRVLAAPNRYVAISAGRVFAFSRAGRIGARYTVDAIDLTSGRVDWSSPLGVTAVSSLALTVDGGRVFAAADGDSPPGSGRTAILLGAFRASNGRAIWRKALNAESFPTPMISAHGILYFEGEGFGGLVYAIRERDGRILWTVPLVSGNPVTLAGGQLVVAGDCGRSYGIDISSGRVRWARGNCSGGEKFLSSFDGRRVWANGLAGGDPGRVIDPRTGRVVRRFSGYTPAFGYGEAVQPFVLNESGLGIRAFSPRTLTVRWSFGTRGDAAGDIDSLPLLGDGYVFAEGGQGQVWALSHRTGRVLWKGQAGAPGPVHGFDQLPGLAAGDHHLVVLTATGLTAFRGT
jgi:outer membrane protein assembly factor BamB